MKCEIFAQNTIFSSLFFGLYCFKDTLIYKQTKQNDLSVCFGWLMIRVCHNVTIMAFYFVGK